MAVTRSGLLWIYSSPATNITAANPIANIAFANSVMSFIPSTSQKIESGSVKANVSAVH
jgi:hypothetical protein